MSTGYLYRGYFNYYKTADRSGGRSLKSHNFHDKTERQVNDLRKTFQVEGYVFIGEKVTKYANMNNK